jgi:hypothetical protein
MHYGKKGPRVGDSVFSFGDLSPFFYLKKTLATNTKGVFHLKSPKTDSNLFGRGGQGAITFMPTGCSFKSSLK